MSKTRNQKLEVIMYCSYCNSKKLVRGILLGDGRMWPEIVYCSEVCSVEHTLCKLREKERLEIYFSQCIASKKRCIGFEGWEKNKEFRLKSWQEKALQLDFERYTTIADMRDNWKRIFRYNDYCDYDYTLEIEWKDTDQYDKDVQWLQNQGVFC